MSSYLWKKVNRNSILVDLEFPSEDLVQDLKIKKHSGKGLAIIGNCDGDLYYKGEKISLYKFKRKRNGRLRSSNGFELYDELYGKPVLNSNVLDALFYNQHLIPENWKKRNEDGNILLASFWGTIYIDKRSRVLFVKYLFFDDDQRWHRGFGWLNGGWSNAYPVAVLGGEQPRD